MRWCRPTRPSASRVEDARDYANSNCWETMIEGRSDQELIRGENFLLFLELALNRGRSHVHGPIGPDTGDPRAWRGYGDLMEAWKVQADTHIGRGIEHIGSGIADGTLEHSSHGRFRYNPLLSTLTRDCLERERDIIRGGARYRIWHVMGEAVANAVDAVSAIRTLVYDERAVSMDELLRALEADWEGFENLRRRFASRAPRFANDSDYADDIGREMMRWYVERTRAHASRFPNVIFPCSIGTFSWYAMIGKEARREPRRTARLRGDRGQLLARGRRGHVGPDRGDQLVPQDERRRAGRRGADRPALLVAAACAASRARRAWPA